MTKKLEAAQRRSHVAHVQATNSLEGARMSSYMNQQMAEYEKGRISSAQLVAQARVRYGLNA